MANCTKKVTQGDVPVRPSKEAASGLTDAFPWRELQLRDMKVKGSHVRIWDVSGRKDSKYKSSEVREKKKGKTETKSSGARLSLGFFFFFF